MTQIGAYNNPMIIAALANFNLKEDHLIRKKSHLVAPLCIRFSKKRQWVYFYVYVVHFD